MLKKIPRHHTPGVISQIKQHTLTSTTHEILSFLTPQNKPQTLPTFLPIFEK